MTRDLARSLYALAVITATLTLSACGGAMLGGHPDMARAAASDMMPRMEEPAPVANTERYTDHGVNPWTTTAQDHLSTFAVDVDTGAYAICRRKLEEETLPPEAAVRVEEFVNAFDYHYSVPDGALPFAVHAEAAPSPFTEGHHFVRIGLKGQEVSREARLPANLVFLVDVSGSMSSSDKLGLAQEALIELVDQLDARDTVSLVTYAGNTSVVLEATPGDEKMEIIDAIEGLTSGGSTAMGSGLSLAYEQAMSVARPGVTSRVIVLSDGDANVGHTAHGDMLDSIRHYINEGITLSAIGVGMGNYQDTTMEQLADLGNGNYFYFDDMDEARRVFNDDLVGTLQVIARDAKVQVEWDPAVVERYRLIGYENRDVADEDFRVDAVDGGEIGAGHQVTAVYEVVLAPGAEGRALGTVRVRHKTPGSGADAAAHESVHPMAGALHHAGMDDASEGLRFAVAVAAFAEVLRASPHADGWSLEQILALAEGAAGVDAERRELVGLIERAIALQPPVVSQR